MKISRTCFSTPNGAMRIVTYDYDLDGVAPNEDAGGEFRVHRNGMDAVVYSENPGKDEFHGGGQ